jgi:hypothetical protein
LPSFRFEAQSPSSATSGEYYFGTWGDILEYWIIVESNSTRKKVSVMTVFSPPLVGCTVRVEYGIIDKSPELIGATNVVAVCRESDKQQHIYEERAP